MNQKVIDLIEYDINSLKDDSFNIVLARRGSGKTTFLKWLLSTHNDRRKGMYSLIAGSIGTKLQWTDLIHPLYCHENSTSFLSTLIETQNANVRKYSKLKKDFPDHRKVTLIIDDMGSNKAFWRSSEMNYLASNSRWLKIRIFIIIQFFHQLPPAIRSQTDVLFALSITNSKTINKIAEEFTSGVTPRELRSAMAAATKNYGVLVIDSSAPSKLHYSRANWPYDVKECGSYSSWDFAESHYLNLLEVKNTIDNDKKDDVNTDDEDDDEDDDDDGDDDDIEKLNELSFMSQEELDILNNKYVYYDRFGKIIVAKRTNKKKID